MRSLPTSILSQFQAREGIRARLLVWIVARNRDTQVSEAAGFWTGEDHQEFTIDGAERTYFGAGALISTEPLSSEVGLSVRSQRITLSPIAPEVAQIVRGYETRLAPAEMHVAYFDLLSHALLDAPQRVFKGWVNTVDIVTPARGGDASIEVELLSSAHALTRTLPLKKSDQALKARATGDRFRRYIDISGAVECVWGEKKSSSPGSTGATTHDPVGPDTSDPEFGR